MFSDANCPLDWMIYMTGWQVKRTRRIGVAFIGMDWRHQAATVVAT